MQKAFLTSRADVEIIGKFVKKDDISEIENFMVSDNNYLASVDKESFILDLIKRSGVFAVNFSKIKDGNKTRIEGKYFDKFQKFGISKKEAEKINCPLVGGAESFECELNRIIEMGKKTIIVGNILKRNNISK